MTELPEDSQTNTSHSQRSGLVVDRDYIGRLRELKLELTKARSEASAARLEARVADLELRIQRMGGRIDDSDHPVRQLRFDQADAVEPNHAVGPAFEPRPAAVEAEETPPYIPAIARDRQVRSAQAFRRLADREIRVDVAESQPNKPSQCVDAGQRNRRAVSPTRIESWDDVRRLIENPLSDSAADNVRGAKDSYRETDLCVVPEVSGDAARSQSRRRPSAWLWSVLVHGLILVFLALITFSATPPGDQIAIAGSVADTDALEIESIEIKTAEIQPSLSEPMPSEVEYEISDIGEIEITEPILDGLLSPPSPLMDSMKQNQAMNAASMSRQSDSDAKMKFCGVEGGGNHFVYLVDSSSSMGSAFESAREQLMQSIDVLKPSQRFYVIFFDAESDYMRLSSPDRDEARSAYATPQNKAALRRWAMTIGMDRGRAPYDALPFAIDLDPDVIFLLSDGEFPQTIEDLLKDINRVDNLFGDNGPISIVHTIGYHSREGESESLMKRIAKQNGGQYRHVPKP